ncbi:hypothetical protein BS330_34830 [Amycolatopsis keratiniphila subsp. nogabecina]|nr:hypothetical protein BS330_34830 [Amycolatopsis keratiniphila subsp. nogabecina]
MGTMVRAETSSRVDEIATLPGWQRPFIPERSWAPRRACFRGDPTAKVEPSAGSPISGDPDGWRITYHDQSVAEWREHPGPVTQLLPFADR